MLLFKEIILDKDLYLEHETVMIIHKQMYFEN
jgi:hypothetical protein